jgi:hypothetical protein
MLRHTFQDGRSLDALFKFGERMDNGIFKDGENRLVLSSHFIPIRPEISAALLWLQHFDSVRNLKFLFHHSSMAISSPTTWLGVTPYTLAGSSQERSGGIQILSVILRLSEKLSTRISFLAWELGRILAISE